MSDYYWEVVSLCGHNHDPELVRFGRKCFDAGYAKAKAEQEKSVDPYQSEDYQRFVASMVEHCHCSEQYKPCDGVLAGGICDGLVERPDDESYWLHYDADGEEPDDFM